MVILHRGQTDLTLEGIRVVVRSLGGIATTITLPQLGLTIDMGVCTTVNLRTGVVALTHTHADHVAGIHQYLGVRKLYGMKPARFLVPKAACDTFMEYLDAIGRLQGTPFLYQVEPVSPGRPVPLKADYYVAAFPTAHRTMAAHGYMVFRRTRKLKPEFKGLDRDSIIELRRREGDRVFDVVDQPLVTITGDTTLEGLPHQGHLALSARLFFLETTFMGDRRTPDYAHLGGHVHLDEIEPILDRITSPHLFLYHISQSLGPDEIERFVRQSVVEQHSRTVHVIVPGQEERL